MPLLTEDSFPKPARIQVFPGTADLRRRELEDDRHVGVGAGPFGVSVAVGVLFGV
jgi:hypothetical protein